MGVGLGACAWREIEVVRAESGAPSVVLHGGAAALADERGVPAGASRSPTPTGSPRRSPSR